MHLDAKAFVQVGQFPKAILQRIEVERRVVENLRVGLELDFGPRLARRARTNSRTSVDALPRSYSCTYTRPLRRTSASVHSLSAVTAFAPMP